MDGFDQHIEFKSDVFVVVSPSALGQRTHWALMMRGGFSTTSEFLLTNGQAGAAIAYSSSAKTRRTAFCSMEFQAAHPTVFEILKTTSTQHGARWKWLETEDELVDIAKKIQGKGRDAELIVFVSLREFKHRGEARHKHCVRHVVTLSRYHLVTLSPCHPGMVSLTHVRTHSCTHVRFCDARTHTRVCMRTYKAYSNVKYLLTERSARTLLSRVDRAHSVGGLCGF